MRLTIGNNIVNLLMKAIMRFEISTVKQVQMKSDGVFISTSDGARINRFLGIPEKEFSAEALNFPQDSGIDRTLSQLVFKEAFEFLMTNLAAYDLVLEHTSIELVSVLAFPNQVTPSPSLKLLERLIIKSIGSLCPSSRSAFICYIETKYGYRSSTGDLNAPEFMKAFHLEPMYWVAEVLDRKTLYKALNEGYQRQEFRFEKYRYSELFNEFNVKSQVAALQNAQEKTADEQEQVKMEFLLNCIREKEYMFQRYGLIELRNYKDQPDVIEEIKNLCNYPPSWIQSYAQGIIDGKY